MMRDIQLLDCTLRDGGYINEWKWGFATAKSIIHSLVSANVDIVEVGFLRNVNQYDENVTISNSIEDLNRLLPTNGHNTIFSAMAMRSNYDIDQLSTYSGSGIEMVRITAHDYDIFEGLEFAREVQRKGYKACINPINIMGYSDEKIIEILKAVNDIHPYQFSIVDTFGSMRRRDLDRIVSLADNNLSKDIRLGLHLHENMSLSCSLVQNYLDKFLCRPIAVDGSLMGMGRNPGNLPLELVADYLNEYMDKYYDIDFMMDAIYDHIAPIKGENAWGYSPAYFLSARFNLHRNYSEFLLKKGDLTNRDINHILSRISQEKKTVYDEMYIEQLYRDYEDNCIDDKASYSELLQKLRGKRVLLIAPGRSIRGNEELIIREAKADNRMVISINFVPQDIPIHMVFYSNSRRFSVEEGRTYSVIATSNIVDDNCDYRINYNRISSAFTGGCNSLVMMLKFLKDIGMDEVAIAGADGYDEQDDNYYDNSMRSLIKRDTSYNIDVAEAIKRIGIKVQFITPSRYELYMR